MLCFKKIFIYKSQFFANDRLIFGFERNLFLVTVVLIMCLKVLDFNISFKLFYCFLKFLSIESYV